MTYHGQFKRFTITVTYNMHRSFSPPSGPRHHSTSPRSDLRRSVSPPRGPRKPKELSFYKKSSSSLGSFSHRRDPLEDESARERMERRDRGEVPARFGGTREQGVRNTMSAAAPQAASMGSLRRGVDPLDRMPIRRGDEVKEDGRRDGMGMKGGNRDTEANRNGDKAREDRVAAMEKTERRPSAAPTSAPSCAPFSRIDDPAGISASVKLTPLCFRASGRLIEVIANDRLGRKGEPFGPLCPLCNGQILTTSAVRVKCLPTDTVGDLKRLIAAQTGTTAQKIQLKKW